METSTPSPSDNSSNNPGLSQPVSHAANKQKKFFPTILGALVLLIIGAGGGYYVGSQQIKPDASQLASPTPITTATPIPTPVTTTKEYKTRHFTITDNFWDKVTYPAELTQEAESSLTPTYCSQRYSGYEKNYSYYDEKAQQSVPLTDSVLLEYVHTLNKKYADQNQSVTEILYCTPEQGKTIVLYGLGPCGGGCSGIPYIGVVNGSNIQEAGTMQESMPYFGCRQPLQLTQDNVFYFSCGGGDGPGASTSIYKLSLNNLALSKVKHCEAGIDEAGKSYSTCE